jgi:cytidine deaminase
MRPVEIKTSFSVYTSETELPEADQKLLQTAKSVLGDAYAPYSKFHVAAAVLLANGDVVTSTNYENASYPICVCAEHSALIAASNRFPNIPPTAVAITVKTVRKKIDRPALPCGSCRQVICETEYKNNQTIRVILQGETGEVFVFENGKAMLPLAFDGSYL